MAGEKYITATAHNPFQIAVRNILNPCGYFFLGNCSDGVSLIRLIRSYQPDFIVVDLSIKLNELRNVIETVDDEMLCACVIIGDYKSIDVVDLLEKSKVVSFCPKPLNKEILVQTVDMANINYKRVRELNEKLNKMTENYETRKLVDRAKWILMERDGITEDEAYKRMRNKSMNSRTSMKSIAEAIIFTNEMMQKKD